MDISVNISREDKLKIKKSSRARKIRERLKCGFKSIFKSPIKSSIAILYVIMTLILWTKKAMLMEYLQKNDVWRIMQSAITKISPELYQNIFIYGFLVLVCLVFFLLIGILGIPIYWGRKFENACISAGIYTKAWKSPFMLDKVRHKHDPKVRIWIIYGNGNDIQEFNARREKLQSELGVRIHSMKEYGVQKIEFYVYPDKSKNQRSNRADINF